MKRTNTRRFLVNALLVAVVCILTVDALELAARAAERWRLVDTSFIRFQKAPVASWQELLKNPDLLNTRFGHVDPGVSFHVATRNGIVSLIPTSYDLGSGSTIPIERHEATTSGFRPYAFRTGPDAAPLRVLCVGGSSVHGTPLTADKAFCAQLQDVLAETVGAGEVACVNGGIVAATSATCRRTVALLAPLFKPHVVVIYTGHNDNYPLFADHRPDLLGGAGRVPLVELYRRLAVLRVGSSLFRERLRDNHVDLARAFEKRYRFPSAADVETWSRVRTLIETNYRKNLEAIVAETRAAGAEPVLMSVASNLNQVPWVSIHDPSFARAAAAEFARGMADLDALFEREDYATVRERAASLLAEDPSYARLLHHAGVAAARTGYEDDARKYLRAARDLLYAPVTVSRGTARMEAIVAEVAAGAGAPFIRTEAVLLDTAGSVLDTDRLYADDIHYSAEGNLVLARAIAETMNRRERIGPHPKPSPSQSESRTDDDD